MQNDEQIYNDIKKRIDDLYGKRAEFFSHLVGFVVVMVIAWGFTDIGYDLGPIGEIFSVLWLMGLSIHAVQTYFEEMKERALQRELERVGLLTPRQVEKAKHHPPERLVHLSDDGELIDYDDDQQAQYR